MTSILITLLAICFALGLAASPSPLATQHEMFKKVETLLRKDCGESCVKMLSELTSMPELRNAAPQETTSQNMSHEILNVLTDNLVHQAAYLDRVLAQRSTFLQSSRNTRKNREKQPLMLNMKMVMADTPCNSQTLCSIDALVANKCSYMRQGLQLAYQSLNVVVHVMGALITVLCGCMFVHGGAFCILGSIPPVCIRPYSVYSKAFSASMQTWESVMAMTKTCIIHGSPLISS